MEPTPTPTPADRLRARLKTAERADVLPTPRTWDPRNNDDDPNPLIGALVSISTIATRFGPAQVAAIRDADGETWACWITSAVLRSEWDRESPVPGDHIAVQYGGTRDTKDGKRHYPLFTVLTDDEDAAPATGAARFGEAPS